MAADTIPVVGDKSFRSAQAGMCMTRWYLACLHPPRLDQAYSRQSFFLAASLTGASATLSLVCGEAMVESGVLPVHHDVSQWESDG